MIAVSGELPAKRTFMGLKIGHPSYKISQSQVSDLLKKKLFLICQELVEFLERGPSKKLAPRELLDALLFELLHCSGTA